MRQKTEIDYCFIHDSNIINRANLLNYVTSLKPAANIHYTGPRSYYTSNTLSDSKISIGSDCGTESFDLIVLFDPDEQTLRKAYSAMLPGSYIYIEWTAAIYSKTNRFINTLYSIGFEEVNTYLPKPDPSHFLPTIFIPLETSGAIEYLIDASHKTVSSNMLKRAGYYIRKLLWETAPKLFLTYPWLLSSSLYNFTLCSMARKLDNQKSISTADADSKDNGININLFDKLKKEWTDMGLGEQPSRLSNLVLLRGRPAYNKIILFIFAESDPAPAIVVKLPLNKESEYENSNEEKVLKNLNMKDKRIEGIPNLLFSENNPKSQMTCQSYIGGTPVNLILNSNNYPKIAKSVTHWLIEFAKQTRNKRPIDWRSIFIEKVIYELESCIGSLLKPGTIENTNKILREFETPFSVCEHRDFSPVNVNICSEGKLGVIDWEDSRLCGIPALDLIFFLTRSCTDYKVETGTKTTQESYRKMLDKNSTTGAIFHFCINKYSSELGIPQTAIPILRMMTWIAQAHTKFLDVTTGTLKPQEKLSHGSRLAIDLWEKEVLIQGKYMV